MMMITLKKRNRTESEPRKNRKIGLICRFLDLDGKEIPGCGDKETISYR